jgi:cytosine/creatinine deaminase
MTDLLVVNACLPDGSAPQYLAASKGVWSEIGEMGEPIGAAYPQKNSPAVKALCERLKPEVVIDAERQLLSPPFVDSHFHMDATLSLGLPRLNESGTLLEGIALWSELKPHLTQDAIIERALRYCDWAVAKGLLAIRSHVDVCDPRLLAVEALLEVKRRVAPYLDLQLVAFPQDGVLRYQPQNARAGHAHSKSKDSAFDLLKQALDLGVDVVGGIPHFERTMADGALSVRMLCEEAAKRGLRVDMHCDETDDPMSRHIETLIFETQRLGLQGRVNGSHLTSMHSMDNYYVSKLLPLMREAQVSATANPLINITIQGRHDSYPKRRGMTRVPEMLAHGINVSFGHDCVMDPWYSLGSADMLEVAQMGLHVAQMTGQAAMRQCFAAVTENPAKILGLEGYGLKLGCRADAVLLQAKDSVEAIRLRAARLKVIRAGQVIAEAAASVSALKLVSRPAQVDWRFS